MVLRLRDMLAGATGCSCRAGAPAPKVFHLLAILWRLESFLGNLPHEERLSPSGRAYLATHPSCTLWGQSTLFSLYGSQICPRTTRDGHHPAGVSRAPQRDAYHGVRSQAGLRAERNTRVTLGLEECLAEGAGRSQA
jgi:hypothetical protein